MDVLGLLGGKPRHQPIDAEDPDSVSGSRVASQPLKHGWEQQHGSAGVREGACNGECELCLFELRALRVRCKHVVA